MVDDFLDRAGTRAFAKLRRARNDPRNLSEPFRTLAVVYAAQGVLDNGGLRYFFESDWPGQPPYELFAQAYRAIGATERASAIEQAAKEFAFASPEHDRNRRCELLDGAVGIRIDAIDRQSVAGRTGENVWSLLAAFARSHEHAFRRPWWRPWC